MKKYRLRLFRYNNYQIFQERLDNMAEKGWFLDKVGTFFWVYKKGEPRKLTHEISFFPDGPDLNYYTTEGQETFLEYCEDAGWKLVGTDGKIHVFATYAENPIPIENDEKLKLNNLHRAMKKGPLFNLIIFVFFQALQFFDYDYDLWRRIATDPEEIFTYQFFSSLSFKVFFSLIVIYSLLDYMIWYLSSKRAFSKGLNHEYKPSKIKKMAEKLLAYIMLGIIVVVFIGACLNGGGREIFSLIVMLIGGGIAYAISSAMLNKTKLDKGIIIFVTPCIAFMAVLIIGELLTRYY